MPDWLDPGEHVDDLFAMAWWKLGDDGRFAPRQGMSSAPSMLVALLRLP